MPEEAPVGRVLAELLGALSAGVQYLLQVDLVRLERLHQVVTDGGDEEERQQLEQQIAHARGLLDTLARVPERLAAAERAPGAEEGRAAGNRTAGDLDAS